ncbi:hypothetical protein LXD69_16875 [Flavobacterium sediminilitoris]|uniref:Uncharacterized protein n=1 Tax=Flavobacterium sediminilitoris TaxID=2024526 RepID=A0ABY4HPH2_9FLAO|nr:MULTISPECIES: hypothetical protein [Flavobacterium]UOX33694.1 hypothetical protein LXD69_16875 [Flavobacterium sediminilitoris]
MRKIHHKIANKTKIILILFIILFFKGAIYSQSLDEIKKTDTIYIYIDRNKKYSIREETFGNEKSEFYKNYIMYRFNPDPMNIISFSSNTYKNRDNIKKGIKNDERIEKKSFLKKNKDIILDYAFFEKNGFKEIFFEIYKKTVYLIDKEEIKGRKIKVKQVDIACYTCFEE